MTLPEALALLADRARANRLPPPSILTDLGSARLLADMLAGVIGCSHICLSPGPGDVVAMYDGVQIVARYDRAPNAGFREHFGVLAEIWSD